MACRDEPRSLAERQLPTSLLAKGSWLDIGGKSAFPLRPREMVGTCRGSCRVREPSPTHACSPHAPGFAHRWLTLTVTGVLSHQASAQAVCGP